MQQNHRYPFTAVLSQEELQLCLLLNLVDPSIGGVLATGDKGTAKTTLVRGLSQLMGTTVPFVNLPIGATEDRVLGSINLEALLNHKVTQVDRGLLAQAHQGFLYIDEVNLLNDYLMDVLLDASVTGGYHLEREGISQWLDSRFCLVGTMNPEEGTLRPQLLDRFGLSVHITTPTTPEVRAQIAMQRLDFDSDPVGFYQRYADEEQQLKERIAAARQRLTKVVIPEGIPKQCAAITIAQGVEGMRADILLLKTARAYAAYHQKDEVTMEMVNAIAPFVLQHRAKSYTPPSDPSQDQGKDKESDASDSVSSSQNESQNTSFQLPKAVQQGLQFSAQRQTKSQQLPLDTKVPKRSVPYPEQQQPKIALFKSIRQYLISGKFATIYQNATQKATANIVFLIDTSSSMAWATQIAYVKGIITKTLESYPKKQVQYALVGLEGTSAKIMQSFTSHTQTLTTLSEQLRTGGKTNLGAAFSKVYEVIRHVNPRSTQLFVFTDGKANAGASDPFQYAIQTYKQYLNSLSKAMIIDTEQGMVRLGRAKRLAEALRLDYRNIDSYVLG